QLLEAIQLKDSLSFKTRQVPLGNNIRYAVAAALNGDKYSDVIVLTDNPIEVQVFVAKPNGTFSKHWSWPLESADEKLVVGDINADGKPDLIFYTKKAPGLTVFLGKGGGLFERPKVIFEDISFSRLELIDLNGDKIPDLLGVNWVSNEILLYTGYGDLKFGIPSHIQLQKIPSMIVAAKLDSGSTTDLAFAYPEDGTIDAYFGDGLGGFHLGKTIQIDADIMRMVAADLDGDGKDELCLLENNPPGVDVWINGGNGAFVSSNLFYTGKSPNDIVLFPRAGSSDLSAAVLDSANMTVRVLFSDRVKRTSDLPQSYSLSRGAAGITSIDLNHDGWNDLLVTNSDLQTSSVYLNRKDGRFGGQIVIPSSMNSTGVYAFPGTDSSVGLILSGKREEKIVASQLNTVSYSQSTVSIPTQSNPQILSASIHPETGLLDIYAVEVDRSSQQNMLTNFEQVAPARFIEKDITPVQPLLCGTILSGSPPFLVYLKYAKKEGLIEAYRTPLAEAQSNNAPVHLFDLADQIQPRALLWNIDINGDGIQDLVFDLSEPDNNLYVALGRKDSSYAKPTFHLRDGISIASLDNLKFGDVNSDGKLDIVLNNNLDRTIEVYLGRGDGSFLPRVRLMSSENIGGFTLSDINHDGKMKLIVTDALTGLLRIISLGND
ncbi:MAG TPA: VCBS repeat-containing protein, partial [Bacteroidota bacterium]|nr:VCBS repeat-containing protein [Bacteroidota bacterium]